jgi:hypothetical protein
MELKAMKTQAESTLKPVRTKMITVTMVTYLDIDIEVPNDFDLETEESESHPDFLLYKEVDKQIKEFVRGHAKELEWEPSMEHPLVLATGVGSGE